MEPQHFSFDDLFRAYEYFYFLADTLREENTPAQIYLFERARSLTPPMRVPDLGCGHGRHTNELARRGYTAVGIDIVEGFLHLARSDAETLGVTPEFVHGDIRAFRADGAFDRALMLFDVIGF